MGCMQSGLSEGLSSSPTPRGTSSPSLRPKHGPKQSEKGHAVAKPTRGTIASRNEACVIAMEAIASRVASKAPAPVKRVAWKPAKILAEISIYDHHFGKLCWAPETGTNYDLDIAERL